MKTYNFGDKTAAFNGVHKTTSGISLYIKSMPTLIVGLGYTN